MTSIDVGRPWRSLARPAQDSQRAIPSATSAERKTGDAAGGLPLNHGTFEVSRDIPDFVADDVFCCMCFFSPY